MFRLGRRADLVGWLLTAWPIFFLSWQEFHIEGRFTPLEALAYGAPILALPLLGHLVKALVIRQEHLASTRNYLRNVIDHMGDVLMVIDRNGTIVFGNPALEDLVGPAVGRPCRETLGAGSDCSAWCPAMECLAGGGDFCVRRSWVRAGGERLWFEVHVSPFRESSGEPTGVLEIWRDVTHQAEMEERLREQALTDSLTKLGNSRAFYRDLPREFQRALRQAYPLALLQIDIDHFKQYNDRFGHPAGDRVLHRLGQVIREQIRRDVDQGYRHGGDEFAVILPDLDEAAARGVAGRISASFLAASFPLVALSVGIAAASAGTTADGLIQLADEAMYRAKRAGGDRVWPPPGGAA